MTSSASLVLTGLRRSLHYVPLFHVDTSEEAGSVCPLGLLSCPVAQKWAGGLARGENSVEPQDGWREPSLSLHPA